MNSKILSIAVPCYNSQAYMEKCINSLLEGGEEVEIIIVDDGSAKDDTAAIADGYAEKYPLLFLSSPVLMKAPRLLSMVRSTPSVMY